jgi:hypothetical protein
MLPHFLIIVTAKNERKVGGEKEAKLRFIRAARRFDRRSRAPRVALEKGQG